MDSGQVLTASPLVTHAEVGAGMPTCGGATNAPDTVLLESDPAKEAAAPEAIALALLQLPQKEFSIPTSTSLFDVGASLRLFGSPLALGRSIRSSMARLSFSAVLRAAPSAHGA